MRAVAAGRLWRKALAPAPQGEREGRGCWQMRVKEGGKKRAVKEGLARNGDDGAGMTFKWEEGKGKKEKAERKGSCIRSTNCNCAKE